MFFLQDVLIAAAWVGVVIALATYWSRDNLEPENPPTQARLPARRPRR